MRQNALGEFTYNWQRPSWTNFSWNAERVLPALGEARLRQGVFRGALLGAAPAEQLTAHARTITEEVIDTSEIEGESLDDDAVRSSVARRLGLPDGGLGPEDARADGVVAITLDATQQYAEPLTASRLHRWHAELFPLEREKGGRRAIARWRADGAGPMQVVSGPIHRPTVHFEAPPAERVAAEVDRFATWLNAEHAMDGLIRAAQAHLWFVTVHPYDDGNGRIARAITDMALARDEASPNRFISMSRQIRREKGRYYDILERTQKGDSDITLWLEWFLTCYAHGAEHAVAILEDVLRASRFWKAYQHVVFTARQKNVLERLLGHFEGNVTAKKWAALGKTSLDSAQRDISQLVEMGVLGRNRGGSKNTTYSLREA